MAVNSFSDVAGLEIATFNSGLARVCAQEATDLDDTAHALTDDVHCTGWISLIEWKKLGFRGVEIWLLNLDAADAFTAVTLESRTLIDSGDSYRIRFPGTVGGVPFTNPLAIATLAAGQVAMSYWQYRHQPMPNFIRGSITGNAAPNQVDATVLFIIKE